MAHSLIPVPQDIANAVEDYVRSELRDCARYSNRAPLDDSGVWSLRRLVERAYAHMLAGLNLLKQEYSSS